MGSCRSVTCDNVTKDIWHWAIENKNWITASHIPGILNVEADAESRKNEVKTEWKLNETIFHDLVSYLKFVPTIDIFASRINTQLPHFISYRPDPDAVHINAFTVDWHLLKFYCFSPFSCIGRVIQKIIHDKATGIIIVPNWPNQAWYPLLLDMLICEPFIIPPSLDQLHLPNQYSQKHPLHQQLELLACLVSTQN